MSLIPDEVEVDLFVLVDNAYNNLVRWQKWEDEYGPSNVGETISAYTMMCILSATQALLEQGVSLPYRWVMDQIDSVNERIVISIPDGEGVSYEFTIQN